MGFYTYIRLVLRLIHPQKNPVKNQQIVEFYILNLVIYFIACC